MLHACCHNPTGADLTPDQWHILLEVLRKHDLLPFLDLAYQGFAKGIDEDGAVVRQFAQSGLPLL